jgi:hypothetical protein
MSITDNPSSALAILSKLMQSMGQNAPQQGGGGGGGVINPRAPQMPSGGMPPMPPGSMASRLPQYSGGAQPVPPKQMAPGGVNNQSAGGSFSYDNPKARNAAVVTNALQSLGSFADQQKQHAYQKQVEEARGVVATVLRQSQA